MSANTLVEKEAEKLPDTVFSKVCIDDMQAVIPKLGKLTKTVERAAYNN